ncbi:5-oxoprolinase subunit B family protein [Acuticoccus sp.]|uniref:5-oxoprolinase subunit B family protein n=1 Tax=Acuticoccus sp. TaxID=1904378 RepID=UPI003B5174C2
MGWLDGAVIRPSGEAAFVVEYGEAIDAEVGRRVGALAAALDEAAPQGFVEAVPTFRSVLVLYDPDVTGEDAILAALPDAPSAGDAAPGARWLVPVCVTGAAAEDLEEAAQELGLAPDRLRKTLLAGRYQVGMYGFAPGYAYLSGVDPSLAIPRRAKPRPPMPAGSVIIAGGMAGLCSVSMPTGWYVVGRTALTLFRPDADPMVPFAVGDEIAFEAVSADEIDRLASTPDGGVRALRR